MHLRARALRRAGAFALAVALAACADKANAPAVDETSAITTVILSADILALLPTGTTNLDIWIGYKRTDGSKIPLRELSIRLADITPPLSIDVDPAPCLEDPQHSGAQGMCDMHVSLVARSSGGSQLDSAGVNTTVTAGSEQPINIDLPDLATIGVADTVRLTPPSEISGGTISFVSSDTSTATVASNGLVTAKNVGRVAVRMSNGTATATARIRVAPRVDRALAVGDQFSCALDLNGEAWCWGLNASGQLGDGTVTNRSTPVRVGGSLVFREIVASSLHACGVSVAFRLYCWGQDPLRPTSPTVAPTLIPSTEKFESATISFQYVCALNASRRAFCFGLNSFGALGRGDTVSSPVPIAVSGGLTFSTVGAGILSACGLVGTDSYCWGSNGFRTFGTATNANSFVPVPTSGGNAFTALWTGAVHSCGLTSGGTMMCWGTSFTGAIGNGPTANTTVPTPTAVPALNGFKQLAFSPSNSFFQSSCGIDAAGAASCWGANSKGQLGTTATLPGSCTVTGPTFPCTGTPTPVATTDRFLTIKTAGENTCGITTTYLIRCWGNNDSGQLGDGTTTNRSTPTALNAEVRLR